MPIRLCMVSVDDIEGNKGYIKKNAIVLGCQFTKYLIIYLPNLMI